MKPEIRECLICQQPHKAEMPRECRFKAMGYRALIKSINCRSAVDIAENTFFLESLWDEFRQEFLRKEVKFSLAV